MLARALSATFDRIWQVHGKRRALELLDRVSAREGSVRARFLWESEAAPLRSPNVQHAAGGLTHVEVQGRGADATLLTYVPTHVAGERAGVIELRESMRPRHDYIRSSLLRTGIATAGIALWCAALASVLGVSLVGRPIGKLVEQARRIGSGELGARVDLPRRYELGELASEMNAMAERLNGAHVALASEPRRAFSRSSSCATPNASPRSASSLRASLTSSVRRSTWFPAGRNSSSRARASQTPSNETRASCASRPTAWRRSSGSCSICASRRAPERPDPHELVSRTLGMLRPVAANVR